VGMLNYLKTGHEVNVRVYVKVSFHFHAADTSNGQVHEYGKLRDLKANLLATNEQCGKGITSAEFWALFLSFYLNTIVCRIVQSKSPRAQSKGCFISTEKSMASRQSVTRTSS